MIDDRRASALVSWMSERDAHWRGRHHHRRAGPHRRCAAALPHALRVPEGFHVLRLGFVAVDDVRWRIQQGFSGTAAARDDPLYRIRRLLRRGHDHPSERPWARLLAGLDTGDTTDEQLARTWIVAAQDPCPIVSCPDRAHAEQALYRWLAYCAGAGIPELTRLARTIDSWRAELLACFDTGGVIPGISVRVA